MKANPKIIAFFCITYAISWVIPISFLTGENLGYEGAQFAHAMLKDGFQFFISNQADAPIAITKITEKIVGILGGLPNELFIIAAILTLLNKNQALYFIAPCVVIMLMWGIGDIRYFVGGYGLWLLSGIGLFLVSAIFYKDSKNIKFISLLSSPPLLIAMIVGSIWLLNGAIQNAA